MLYQLINIKDKDKYPTTKTKLSSCFHKLVTKTEWKYLCSPGT